MSYNELPGLLSYLDGRTLPFRYVSVHAPVKGDRVYNVLSQLATLPLWVRSIVTHPDAIDSLPAHGQLTHRLVLENMDDRKTYGRTADELAELFAELPAAGFCLDVAHAWSVDPTMSSAHELLDAFRSRLRHVHVSSLRDGRHVTLRRADEELFTDVLARCRDVPWILEAPLREKADF